MELIYILTYECNFRCTYCDINKRKEEMSEKIRLRSLEFLAETDFEIEKVKFFGGEPLLKKDFVVSLIKDFPIKYHPNFFVTSNSTLVNDEFMAFSRIHNLCVTFSIDGTERATAENRLLINGNNLSGVIKNNTEKYAAHIRVNQVITSGNATHFFDNFKYIYNLGVREFNFLPEYYRPWSKQGLVNLKKGFDAIFEYCQQGNKFAVVNLDNYSESSFFNFGLVIDVDGRIYGTNLILSGIFEKYKNDLCIGDVFNGLFINPKDVVFKKNYLEKVHTLIVGEYELEVLNSVKYVDLILNNFCNEFETYRDKYLKSMQ